MGLVSCRASPRFLISAGLMPSDVASSFCLAGVLRHELVQRRIEQADRDRQAVHRFQRGLDALLDEREQFGQRRLPLVDRLAQDHLPQQEQRLVGARAVEHVLGAEQADALGAELAGHLGVFRRVGVGADAQRAELVAQLMNPWKRGFSVASIIATRRHRRCPWCR